MAKIVSHKQIVDTFYNEWELNPVIFDIVAPYKKIPGANQSRKRKRKLDQAPPLLDSPSTTDLPQRSEIQLKFDSFIESQTTLNLPETDTRGDNKDALNFMSSVQSLPYPTSSFNGANTNHHSIGCEFNGEDYLIPRNCRFFNKNVLEIPQFLPLEHQFDFIVMDPPWWNKYIRRINSVKQEIGYKMLDNEGIKSLPIDELLSDKGLVAIWCTNSPSHREAIEKEMLVHWKLKLITVWHWIKVTSKGEPICDFHPGTGKQPYELIFIAGREDVEYELLPKDHMLVSVPSVIHSHKFPVFDVLKPYLPPSDDPPKCLEIFARYLQPGFTSVGLEVLKLQNKKLFLDKENIS